MENTMVANINMEEIRTIFNSMSDLHEFEVMFGNYKSEAIINREKFVKLLNFAKIKFGKDDKELITKNTLDVVLRRGNTSYRIQVEGIGNINAYLSFLSKKGSHYVLSFLASRSKTDSSITLSKKIKDFSTIKDINQYSIRIRSSVEDSLTNDEIGILEKPTLDDRGNITFRYKQRITGTHNQSDTHRTHFDLTIARTTKTVSKIGTTDPTYEVEIDYMSKKKGSSSFSIYPSAYRGCTKSSPRKFLCNYKKRANSCTSHLCHTFRY